MTASAMAPRSIGAVLDSAWQLWRQGLRRLLPVSLAFVGVEFLPVATLSAFAGRPTIGTPTRGWAFALYEGAAVVVFLFRLLLSLALTIWYRAVALGETPSVGASMKHARHLLARRIRAALVVGGVAGIATFLTLLIFGALIRADRAHAVWYGSFTLGPMVILVAYFWMRCSLSGALIAVEGTLAIDSLRQSWRLTQGHGGRTTAVLVVLIAFFLVLYLLVAGLASALDGLTGMPQALIPSQAVLGLGILNPWAEGLYAAGSYSLYVDLKARRQGEDLRLKIEQLANA